MRCGQQIFSDFFDSIRILYQGEVFLYTIKITIKLASINVQVVIKLCLVQRNGVFIMLSFLQFFYQFQFPMQVVDKLFTNSTNRLPILPEPHFRTALLLPTLSAVTHTPPVFHSLMAHHSLLESQVSSAREQLKMMEELFYSFQRAERGESKLVKRSQRRCKKDIIDRHVCPHEHCRRSYSSQPSLQRHVKIKHHSGRMEPPQLYNDLPPEPNLTEQTGSEEESHTDAPLIGEEANSEREFT